MTTSILEQYAGKAVMMIGVTVATITPEMVVAVFDIDPDLVLGTYDYDAYAHAVRRFRWCADYTEAE